MLTLFKDKNNHMVRYFQPLSNNAFYDLVGTPQVAGFQDGATAKFAFPHQLYFDSSLNRFLIADYENHCIRSVFGSSKFAVH